MSSGRNWRSGRDYGAHVPNMHPVFPPSVPLRAISDTSGGSWDYFFPLEERVITGPTPGNWRSGREYGALVPYMQPELPQPPPPRATPIPLEERAITGPFGFTSFPVQPHPQVRILVLDNDRAREVSPRPRPFVHESPPRFMEQRNMQVPTQEAESRLSQEEQKKALNKLKNKIYNPTPKTISKRVNLYYRDYAGKGYNEKEKEIDEDGKRCAICLDDFEPKEEVTLTPCNHMFHEDCIVPWVKSHGQCPVCRFSLCERIRESTLPLNNNNNTANMAANDLFPGELMAIIRAIDEIEWWTVNR